MLRHRGIRSAIFGLFLGFLLGIFMSNYRDINSPTSQHVLQRPSPTKWSPLIQNLNTNISSSSLAFVGVMTAQKYLDSRAKAVWETWGKQVPGKMAFFSSEYSQVPENCPDLPLVALPTVDDGYPPQKKSFLMLQFMWNNFADKFEWFIRADDDVYIRTDKLEKLLRSIDSSKPMYIGQAGRGNSEEIGQLSLNYDENFCMGGPGVIISRETMRRIIPHIKECLKNLYTTHEDVELGRCVRKYAGISCTWSYEMQSILYHNSSGDQSFTGNLKRREVHQAITLHPIKNPPHMYRLHNYMRGLKIQDLQQERVSLYQDIYSTANLLGKDVDEFIRQPLARDVELFPHDLDAEDYLNNVEILGLPDGLKSFKPRSAQEVIPWDFISKSEYSLVDSNPRRRIYSHVKEGLEDITREVMASINSCSRQRGRVVEERSTLYGYRRVDAFGADTVLDLLLVYRKYRGRKVTLPVRRHVYVHQCFTGVEVREVVNDVEVNRKDRESQKPSNSIFSRNFLFNYPDIDQQDPVEDKIIHFIVPLFGKFVAFERFMNNYEQICLRSKAKTELIIVLYPHQTENSFDNTKQLLSNIKKKYLSAKIDIIDGSGNFSRARALDLAVSYANMADLLFFIDVDITFTAEALDRIRLNTIIDRKVYFPIVFSQYDPQMVYKNSENHDFFVINEFTGYWRQFGFGIVSLYKKDYLKIGGFNLSINGWGSEDVNFFEKAVNSDLTVFRAPDLGLVHIYHKVECDQQLPPTQLLMCRGTSTETLASVYTLAEIINRRPEYLRFAKVKRSKLSRNVGS
ncbi:chondroitin sulfate synthase 1 [Chelonus insularis]|uniref:chondroitin sulfate synthase 1 n=1 Tax=Chelonus insularis TaxID=460826 RepID=UPI00158864FE|nr:chondroitin sulfate synthase 1 [Chelonus insularis]